MKIKNISIYAFKGIEDQLNLPIGEQSLLLLGPNGVGKSSILDAIYCVLDSDNMPEQPINIKHENSKVELEMVDEKGNIITATLKINDKGHNLTLKMGEFTVDKPRTYLNKIVGENISFDPIEFAEMSKTAKGKKEQAETILKILVLDLSEIEDAIKDFKEQRLESSRKLESLKAERKIVEKDLPREIEDYSESILLTTLLEEKTLLQGELSQNRQAKQKAEYLAEKIKDTQKQIAELQKYLETLDKDYSIHESVIKKTEHVVEKVLDIDTKIANSENHNKLHKQYIDHKKLVESLATEETTNKNLDAVIKDKNKQKLDVIAERCKTLELGFSLFIDDTGNIYIDKVLMSQLNTARQIEVGIKIYMNSNPKLRILRLSNLSLCDTKTKQSIQELINKNGYQAFVEVISPDSEELTIDIQEYLSL